MSSSLQKGESKSKTKGETIYDEVNNIPDIQKIKDAAAMEREVIKAMSWGGDTDQNGVPDVLEMEKLKQKAFVDAKGLELKEKELKQKKEKDKADLEIKRQANRNRNPSQSK